MEGGLNGVSWRRWVHPGPLNLSQLVWRGYSSFWGSWIKARRITTPGLDQQRMTCCQTLLLGDLCLRLPHLLAGPSVGVPCSLDLLTGPRLPLPCRLPHPVTCQPFVLAAHRAFPLAAGFSTQLWRSQEFCPYREAAYPQQQLTQPFLSQEPLRTGAQHMRVHEVRAG